MSQQDKYVKVEDIENIIENAEELVNQLVHTRSFDRVYHDKEKSHTYKSGILLGVMAMKSVLGDLIKETKG